MGWSFLHRESEPRCSRWETLLRIRESGSPTLASAITGPVATCIFHLKMNGAAVASGMGTCGLVGQIGVYTGWVNDIAEGTKAAITGMDWAGLLLICFILPAVLSWAIAIPMRKCGWIKENDLKLDL